MTAYVRPITGNTICYPLFGHPVAQVSTPPTINRWFDDQAIDAVMFALEVAPSAVDSFFRVLRTWQNCGGFSVTVPHKQAAFRTVDELTGRAQRSGSVNIVRRMSDGRLIGDMTDGLAMNEALRRNGIKLEGQTVLLVGGGGGAGAAISDALCAAGISTLYLIEADQTRQDFVTAKLRQEYPAVDIRTALPPDKKVGIAINATPLGMQSHDPLPFDPTVVADAGIIADVVTKPAETELLRNAVQRGLKIQTGQDMANAQLEFQMRHLGLWPDDEDTSA